MADAHFIQEICRIAPDADCKRTLTNAQDLLRTAETDVLLRLAGEIPASDYEYFTALCRVAERMPASPLGEDCAALLCRFGGIDLPFLPAHCDEIWRACADHLLRHPTTLTDLWASDAPYHVIGGGEDLPAGAHPMLTEDDYFADPEGFSDTAERFRTAGCRAAYLCLGEGYSFLRPDAYHIGEVLKRPHRNREDRNLLLSQAARMLASFCAANHFPLHLRVLCAGYEVQNLLNWLSQTVGLPELLWSSPLPCANLTLWHCMENGLPMRYVLNLSDLRTREERTRAIHTFAARLPADCLLAVTDRDPRYAPLARARFEKTMLQGEKAR